MNNDTKGIAIVGTRARGGIQAVIDNHVQAGVYENYERYIVISHDEGSVFKRCTIYIAAVFQVLFLLVRNKISICHLHGSHKGSICRKAIFIFLCRLFKCKVIFHLHGSVFARTYDDAGPAYKKLVQYVLNRADSVFVLSQFWADYVSGLSNNKEIRVINNFPSPVFESIFEGRTFKPTKTKKLLFLGYIGQRKGIYDLVEAVDILKQRGTSGFTITVGGNGEVEKLKELIVHRRLSDYFDVIGWVSGEQKYQLMKESDLLLLPSHNEGLPIAILEAMSAGLAVLSTTVGGIPEAIPDEHSGVLIEPGDHLALANGISKYLNSDGLIETAARKSRERYNTMYSSTANLKNIRAVLKTLSNSKLSLV